ncbi:hypothetical protein QBC40DRAFT_19994 [Triangularia verruculosa]|uniref:Uncharacterized protein n=1 Tax=Triangularia verruculosa TaxID=2587418 RepID=A0AAN6X884_9PEZI|nr:hypothetical protein QBC40DRAFT_19994 [Triangularia verruculosa]
MVPQPASKRIIFPDLGPLVEPSMGKGMHSWQIVRAITFVLGDCADIAQSLAAEYKPPRNPETVPAQSSTSESPERSTSESPKNSASESSISPLLEILGCLCLTARTGTPLARPSSLQSPSPDRIPQAEPRPEVRFELLSLCEQLVAGGNDLGAAIVARRSKPGFSGGRFLCGELRNTYQQIKQDLEVSMKKALKDRSTVDWTVVSEWRASATRLIEAAVKDTRG